MLWQPALSTDSASRARWARGGEFLLSVGADAGFLPHAVVVARNPMRVLQPGTSCGCSTLFLADAARAGAAEVVSIDLGSDKQAYAHKMPEKAGLAGVEFRAGDAIALVTADPGPLDFVLLDIRKDV